MNLLELHFRAAAIACGACTFFQQTRGGSGGLAPGFHEFEYGFRGGTLPVRQIRGMVSIGRSNTPVRVRVPFQ
jgi:hypothetical protein